MPSNTILAISLFFHLCATVVWVGGLVITVILVWPQARRALEDTPAFYSLMSRLRKQFTSYGNLSLAVLIGTGLVQMSLDNNYNGFMDFGNTWSKVILMKHIALAGMVVCGAALQYGVFPALERSTMLLERGKGSTEEWNRLRQRETRLTWLNVLLGIAVLGFSAWAGTL